MDPDRNQPKSTSPQVDTTRTSSVNVYDDPTGGERAAMTPADAQAYWRTNITLILSLLAVWALVSYGFSILLANPLSNFRIGQIRLSFWFAQQGSIITFVLLIIVYAVLMDRIDNKYNVHE